MQVANMVKPKELEQWIKLRGIPGAALSQVNAAGEVTSFAVGHCNIEDTNKLPVTTMTLFQLASVSKFLTACLLVELSNKDMIDLNSEIAWTPIGWEKPTTTTFSALLQHRGGFSKNIGFTGQPRKQRKESHAHEAQQCVDYYQEYMHGTYRYSGCNYWLIQDLLERRLGCSFNSLLQTWICEPMGLEKTSCEVPNPSLSSVAYGHDGAGRVIEGGWRTFEGVEAAAGIWSTAKDIGQLLKQLIAQTTHASAGRSMLKITDLLIEGKGTGYHYGLLINQAHEGLQLSHRGVNPGYQAMIRIRLSREVATALLINREHYDALSNISMRSRGGTCSAGLHA